MSAKIKKVIVLNGGAKTRRAFSSGLSSLPFAAYHTKQMMLHLIPGADPVFLYENSPVDFTNSYVFTRLRSHDEVFTGILYEHFTANNIPASDAINASYMNSGEKIAQMARLARAGIPIPETIIAREESYTAHRSYIASHLHFPLVYKTDGNKGEAVHKVDTQAELDNLIAQKKPGELFLLQELIPNDFDTRTLVSFGSVLGAIKRSAPAGQFLNNVSQGGAVETFTLTPEEVQVAIAATKAVRQDFGGVDMIHTNAGPVVIEVNKSPQIKGFEEIYGEDFVFNQIAGQIEAGATTDQM